MIFSMTAFVAEFKTLQYIFRQAENVLLFAHTRPDGDTIGATIALKEHLVQQGKRVSIACIDPIPDHLGKFFHEEFLLERETVVEEYDVIVGCDGVERGMQVIMPRIQEKQVVVLIDHHPNIQQTGDVIIIDAKKSSACEILFDYFEWTQIEISPRMATALLVGIVFDTGNFQHACTTPRVLEVASTLMRYGGSLVKAVDVVFANKRVSVLKLWGKAFTKAKIFPESGLIASALTESDLEECGATAEDVYQVVSILSTVPDTRFSLVVFQRDKNTVKGQLRAEKDSGIDVSQIACQLGGGGHCMASGFEIPGRIVESQDGWMIV